MSNVDPALAAMFGRFGTAKPLRDRMNFIKGNGRHIFALVSFGPKNTDKGLIVAWKLLTIESAFHQPGSIVDASVRLYEPEPWKREQEEARGAEFARQLFNPNATPEQLVQLSAQLASPAQVGRGIMIVAHSREIPKKNPKPGKDPNFTEVRWEHMPGQPPEQIAQLRAHIERTVSAEHLNPASVAPPAPQYAQPAAPAWGAQPMQPPAQPQYLAQPPAPQYAQPAQPMQPPPGYGYAPPAAAPQMQPPAQPAPMAWPGMQPPAAPPAQPTAPAGAPSFLANVLGGGR